MAIAGIETAGLTAKTSPQNRSLVFVVGLPAK